MSKKTLLAVVVILLVIGGGVLLNKYKSSSEDVIIPDTTTWKEYKDSKYPFSFKYPPELSVTTRQAPQQWQVDLVKVDTDLEDGFDDSEYVGSFFVGESETNMEDWYGHNPHMILEKAVQTEFKGDAAVRIAFCELDMPYDFPCTVPENDQAVLEQGTKILIDHDGVIYTLMLPWWSRDVELFNGLLSTLTFE